MSSRNRPPPRSDPAARRSSPRTPARRGASSSRDRPSAGGAAASRRDPTARGESLQSRALRVVGAELLAQDLADLPDGAPQAECLPHRHEQVLRATRDPPDLLQRRRGRLRVPVRPDARRPIELAPLRLGIEPVELDRLRLVLLVPVDADDDALARLHVSLVLERRVLDLPLKDPLLNRRHRPAELVHPLDQLPRRFLELRSQRLDEVRAAKGVCSVRPARLVREDLLRPQRDLRRALRRQRERLVERVRVNRSRMMRAQSRRAARNFATSWKKWLCALKKNESRSPNSSGDNPAATAASAYAIPFASVNASSWTAVEPASRMWYPEIEMVLNFGSRSRQYAKRSVVIRIVGRGG